MSRLRKILPAGETVLWISSPDAKVARWRVMVRVSTVIFFLCALAVMIVVVPDPLALAAFVGILAVAILLQLKDLSDTEIAVLSDRVVWKEAGSLGWLFKRDLPMVRLDGIDRIDVEERGNTVTLHCDGEVACIEEIVGGNFAAFVRATGRPGRIWRRCTSSSARMARRWRSGIRYGVSIAIGIGLVLMLLPVLDQVDDLAEGPPEWALAVVGACVSVLLGLLIKTIARLCAETMPHLLVGRSLRGQERRDFVCTVSDPRWDGIQPDDSGALPAHGPIQRWAMRLAYGELPEYGRWEPEVVNGAGPGYR